jgi:signal peptidase II
MAPARVGWSKTGLFFAIVAIVVTLDIVTKAWITQNIALYRPVPIIGDFFRITYTHNPGAAFGINIGQHSRVFFLVLSIAALVVLGLIYRATPASDRVRLAAVSLVSGGAIGNIIDRLRYEQGVVDFLDIGIGSRRWPVFNVADMAVSTGAVLLLFSFYLEGRREQSVDDTG